MILRGSQRLARDERTGKVGMFDEMAHHEVSPTSSETRLLDVGGGEFLR